MSKRVYQDVGLTSQVLGAKPEKLMAMLLDKCLCKIDEARFSMQVENVPNKAKAITKAIDILAYLQSCLRSDTEETQKISNLLSAVYINAEHMLIKANATNDVAYLKNAHSLISEIKSGWGLNNGA